MLLNSSTNEFIVESLSPLARETLSFLKRPEESNDFALLMRSPLTKIVFETICGASNGGGAILREYLKSKMYSSLNQQCRESGCVPQ